MRRSVYAPQLLILIATVAGAAPACAPQNAAPSTLVALPSHPFAVAPSVDGCWLFVSLMGDDAGRNPGIAVLESTKKGVVLSRVAALQSRPSGLALTNDGKLLIASAMDSVLFLDVARLKSADGDPLLGSFSTGEAQGSIYVNVTADDKLLFVSEERAQSITVIDLAHARSSGYKADAIIGKIPVGVAPIALTFSIDRKYLYTTSQGARLDWDWPKACKPEGRDPATAQITRPEGAIVVVDIARAGTDPAQSVVKRIPSGCSPVRMAISPRGDRIYVTARNSNAVLAFDTAKLLSDPDHARLGSETVGAAPVPIAVIDGGTKVIAGNSNRFGGTSAGQNLVVLDAARIGKPDARLGAIPAGAFPREMRVSADGATLYLTNFGSNSLQIIDLKRLPLEH